MWDTFVVLVLKHMPRVTTLLMVRNPNTDVLKTCTTVFVLQRLCVVLYMVLVMVSVLHPAMLTVMVFAIARTVSGVGPLFEALLSPPPPMMGENGPLQMTSLLDTTVGSLAVQLLKSTLVE